MGCYIHGLIVGLPHTQGGHDLNWVTVDKPTKSGHSLVIKTTYKDIHLASVHCVHFEVARCSL